MSDKPLIYIATPYRVTEEFRPYLTQLEIAEVEHLRFRGACRIARLFRDQGFYPFCPMSHTLPVEQETDDPNSEPAASYWLGWDDAFIDVCRSVIIGQMPCWEVSRGVDYERNRFWRQGKPVAYFNPRPHFTADEWDVLNLPYAAAGSRIAHHQV